MVEKELSQAKDRINQSISRLRKAETDKEENIALLGTEIERLNDILKDKVTLLHKREAIIAEMSKEYKQTQESL